MRAIQSAAKWLFRGLIAVVILLIFFLGIVFLLLQQDPDKLADRYLSDISQKTGLKFDLGTIDVTLLPLPSIAVSDLAVTGKDLKFSVAWFSVRPDFLRMLTGDFQPASITLMRPRITATLPINVAKPENIKNYFDGMQTDGGRFDSASFLQTECVLELSNGQIQIKGLEDSAFVVNGLQWNLLLSDEGMARGNIRIGSIRSQIAGDTRFVMDNLEAEGAANPLNFLEESNNVAIKGNFRLPGVIAYSALTAGFESTENGWTAAVKFGGLADLPGHDTKFFLSGKASKLTDSNLINFRDMELGLGADSGRLDATLRLPAKELGFKFSGKALLNRVSLTQWLGFARNLNPGLQLALDNVLDAYMEFSIDARGMSAPRISALCMGARFTGKGGVEDFRKPVVFLDLESQKVNLGAALPESVGKAPLSPWFPHDTLTPMPGEPLKEGETGIDYDVFLGAKTLLYGPLKLDSASLRIHPGKMDKTGLQDVLLTAKSNFYGGVVNAECILGTHPGPPMIITGKTTGISAKNLSRDLTLFPFNHGVFQSSVNVSSKGKDLKIFLGALRGTVSCRGENVTLKSAPKENFKSVSLSSTLRTAFLRKDNPCFEGKWQAALRSADLDINAVIDGVMAIDGSAPGFGKSPGEINVRFEKKMGPIPAQAHFQAKGIWTLSGTRISLGNGSFSLLEQKAKGNVKIDASKMSWEGHVETETSNLEESIRKFGFKNIKVPPAFHRARLAADFSGDAKSLRLANMKGAVGHSSIAGNLAWQNRNNKPHFDFSLDVDKLEWQSQSEGKAASRDKPLDFSFLRDFDAKGQVNVRSMAIMGLKFTETRTPIRLENGKLNFGPASAQFYGSGFQTRGTLDFNSGIGFNCVASVHDFDLGAAAKDRKIEGILTGKASVEAHAQGKIATTGQIPGALNGSWSLTVIDGSWQSRENGKAKGSPTRFEKAFATGIIDRGVLQSKNFSLTSPGLEVSGGGWINLVNDKLECKLNINMKGLPDFPLRLYGTIKKTETSIGAGQMVVNAIGGLTTGVANILVGIFKGAWNIFR